jgi:hypothetical protein
MRSNMLHDDGSGVRQVVMTTASGHSFTLRYTLIAADIERTKEIAMWMCQHMCQHC